MEWKQINVKDLPEGEVLAGNFKSGTYGYKEKLIGYIDENEGIIICESDNEVLENITHYIDINMYDPA